MRRTRTRLALLGATVGLAALLTGGIAAPAAAAPATTASDPTTWLCNPAETPDPCVGDLSTSVYSPTLQPWGSTTPTAVTTPRPACFYVYPTVSQEPTLYSDLTVQPAEQLAAEEQAARWSQLCDVYAPMYHQLTLPGLSSLGAAGTADTAAEFAPGIADVGRAFREFLSTVAADRPFVVIGHSQGSFILKAVLRRQVDPYPSVRARMLSAILPGANVLVRSGSVVGGDFQNIPGCTVAGQTGCVIAYSTFGYLPDSTTWGVSTVPGEQVLCTNPTVLDGSGVVSPIYRSGQLPGLPATTSTWTWVPGQYTATCVPGANVLLLASHDGSSVWNPTSVQSWGLHDLDVNLLLGNLGAAVWAQEATYAAAS